MVTIKSFTDLEQSKKLSKILPFESADMGYLWNGTSFCDYPVSNQTIFKRVENVPCWSLVALYALLPEQTDISKSYSDNCETIIYWCWNSAFDIETKEYDNPVDACVEMIIKLHEQNLL